MQVELRSAGPHVVVCERPEVVLETLLVAGGGGGGGGGVGSSVGAVRAVEAGEGSPEVAGQQVRAMEPPGWQVLDQVEQKWRGLVGDAVVDGRLVERVSKAAKCLESGPSGRVVIVLLAVVPAEHVETVLLVAMVVEVAMMVDGKCWILVPLLAPDVTQGRRDEVA